MNFEDRRRHHLTAAFVTIFIMVPLLWMLLDREPPYTGHIGRAIPDTVQAGDQMVAEWTLQVNRICPGSITRELVDSQNIIWNFDTQPSVRRDQQFDVAGMKRFSRLRRAFIVPEQAAPGPAKFRTLTCYVCNPLQNWWPICLRTPEVEFTILPREQDMGRRWHKTGIRPVIALLPAPCRKPS